MLYEIEQAVFERFPGYARMAVVAEGVDNTREIPELAELLAQCEEGVRRDDLEDFWHVPVLETWAEAFSGMGIKPKKNPPSVINLIKRCRAGKPLPFINPLVAIFNCISLKYLLPCGGPERHQGRSAPRHCGRYRKLCAARPARRAGAPAARRSHLL